MNAMTKGIEFHLPYREVPWLLRKLGCFALERDGLRFRWGEVYRRGRFGLGLYSFEEGYSLFVALFFFQAFIKLPRWLPHSEPNEMCESWGFDFAEDTMLSLHWGKRYKRFEWPFRWRHVSFEALMPDGSWGASGWERNEDRSYKDGRSTEQHPYRYLTSSGEKQEVTATISVRRHTMVRSGLPFWRKVNYEIDIEFSGEVGDRAGSWKGGCVGCSWDMKPGEDPRRALRRMERERKFT